MIIRDYLILLVVLGIVAWLSRRSLARLWRLAAAASDDESSQTAWRFRIILGILLVPPIGVAISNWFTPSSLAFTFQSLIDSIPCMAWIVYAAWISKDKGRWIGIAKWGLIVLFARALAFLAACMTPSSFPEELFWQIQLYLIKSEAVHLFGALVLLMIGGRIFRFHLVRVSDMELKPPRITIPFLMLTQALLAVAISLMFWVTKSNPEGEPPELSTFQLLMLFCFCLSTVLFAFAIFLPSRMPRWALIIMLIFGAVGLRMLVLFLLYREIRLDDDPQVAQMADGMLYIMSWQMAVESILMLGVFAVIRLLFRKAGLVIVRTGFPVQISRSIYS